MRKLILFALTTMFIAPGNIVSARGNTVNNFIEENRDKPLTFYVNLTNRHKAKRTYRKSIDKMVADWNNFADDSVSADSILKILPIESVNPKFNAHGRLKMKFMLTYNDEMQDYTSVFDKANDMWCRFEISDVSDSIMLGQKEQQMVKAFSPLIEQGGMSVYATHTMVSDGMAFYFYSEDKKIQAVIYIMKRPFRIFF